MSVPENNFPPGPPVLESAGDNDHRLGAAGFAMAIAAALRREYRDRGHAVKSIVGLTRANERAVKNWYEGRNGPSGELLILLCRHSDEVLETLLLLAGRPQMVRAKKLVDAKERLREILTLLDALDEGAARSNSAEVAPPLK